MWWGGFSEGVTFAKWNPETSLNPHVVGRFFRGFVHADSVIYTCLNPHVVGRFFRDLEDLY